MEEARPSSRASRARIVLFSVFTVALCATLHEAPACRTNLPRGESTLLRRRSATLERRLLEARGPDHTLAGRTYPSLNGFLPDVTYWSLTLPWVEQLTPSSAVNV